VGHLSDLASGGSASLASATGPRPSRSSTPPGTRSRRACRSRRVRTLHDRFFSHPDGQHAGQPKHGAQRSSRYGCRPGDSRMINRRFSPGCRLPLCRSPVSATVDAVADTEQRAGPSKIGRAGRLGELHRMITACRPSRLTDKQSAEPRCMGSSSLGRYQKTCHAKRGMSRIPLPASTPSPSSNSRCRLTPRPFLAVARPSGRRRALGPQAMLIQPSSMTICDTPARSAVDPRACFPA